MKAAIRCLRSNLRPCDASLKYDNPHTKYIYTVPACRLYSLYKTGVQDERESYAEFDNSLLLHRLYCLTVSSLDTTLSFTLQYRPAGTGDLQSRIYFKNKQINFICINFQCIAQSTLGYSGSIWWEGFSSQCFHLIPLDHRLLEGFSICQDERFPLVHVDYMST